MGGRCFSGGNFEFLEGGTGEGMQSKNQGIFVGGWGKFQLQLFY